MKNITLVRTCGALLVAASATACGYQDTRDNRVRDVDSPTTVVNVPEPRYESPRTTVNIERTPAPAPTVVTVEPDTYRDRVYYFTSTEPDSVYFYLESDPNFIVHRRVFRDGDKTYYVEYVGDTERRIYFDSLAARNRDLKIEIENRERLEQEARERDLKERESWESRWKEMRERHEREMQEKREELERLERLERERSR